MTTVQFTTVAESIANIDLSAHGIRSKYLDKIPVNGITECPFFAPRPDDFISDLILTRVSFGSGGTAKMNLNYTMNWQYYHAPIGQVLKFQSYGNMIANVAHIIEKLADNDAPDGSVDIQIGTLSISPIADASGNMYHGVNIPIRVLEFING